MAVTVSFHFPTLTQIGMHKWLCMVLHRSGTWCQWQCMVLMHVVSMCEYILLGVCFVVYLLGGCSRKLPG